MFKLKVEVYNIESEQLIDVRWFIVDDLELIDTACNSFSCEDMSCPNLRFIVSIKNVSDTEGVLEITEEMYDEL